MDFGLLPPIATHGRLIPETLTCAASRSGATGLGENIVPHVSALATAGRR